MKKVSLFLLIAMITACVSKPETPRQVIASTTLTLHSLTKQVETAKVNGFITDEQKHKALDRLENATDAVEEAFKAIVAFENLGKIEDFKTYNEKIVYGQSILKVVIDILEARQ